MDERPPSQLPPPDEPAERPAEDPQPEEPIDGPRHEAPSGDAEAGAPAPVEPPVPPPPPPEGPDVTAGKIPWEERERLGFLTAFWRTVSESMLAPGEFFRRVGPQGGFGSPALYALLIGFLAAIAGLAWRFLGDFFINTLASELADVYVFSLFGGWVALALTPFIVIVNLFISSAVVHVFLYFLGGARRGYATTFRVMGYAQGPKLLEFLPFCGALFGFFWILVLWITGLARAHGTTTSRAATAVLLPFFLCFGGILATLLSLGIMAGVLER
jgi:hypothetical protein